MERREEGKVRRDEKSVCVRGASHEHVLKKRRTVKVTVTMLQSGHWSGRSDSGHASPKAYPSLAWQYRHMLRRSSAAMCEEARERGSASAREGRPDSCWLPDVWVLRATALESYTARMGRVSPWGAGVPEWPSGLRQQGRVGAGADGCAVGQSRRRASSAGPRPLEPELGASNCGQNDRLRADEGGQIT